MMFGTRVASRVRQAGTPLVVGLDPSWEHLPTGLRPAGNGRDLAVVAEAVETFCCGIVDVVADLVPAVKPQAAFFEALGIDGWQVMHRVMEYAQSRGLLVILDAKRGDIGSTAQAYASAYLSRMDGRVVADALTVNPYLGADTLRPFLAMAQQAGGGVFVLVKTSNPGSGQLQDLLVEGSPVYRRVAEMVEALSCEYGLSSGFGLAGAVVGATYPDQLAELRQVMPHCWFLVPGLGAQGGTAHDVAAAFLPDGTGAFVNSSRAIMYAYSYEAYAQRYPSHEWQRAVEDAVRDTISQLRTETTAGHL